jgi:hypothetical protein
MLDTFNIPSQTDSIKIFYANGTTTWQDAINAIKAKYPKPE